jgi:hypothetical protein
MRVVVDFHRRSSFRMFHPDAENPFGFRSARALRLAQVTAIGTRRDRRSGAGL